MSWSREEPDALTALHSHSHTQTHTDKHTGSLTHSLSVYTGGKHTYVKMPIVENAKEIYASILEHHLALADKFFTI